MAEMLRWLVRFARRVVQAFRRARSDGAPTGIAERTDALPTPERYPFVLERVKAYRDEMLSYEIGLERYRRNASRGALMKALALGNELPEVRSDAGVVPQFRRVGLGSTAASTSGTRQYRRTGAPGSRRRERANSPSGTRVRPMGCRRSQMPVRPDYGSGRANLTSEWLSRASSSPR